MPKKKTYSVAQARAGLPGILDDVDAGDAVYLTRRGHPVAVVLSTRSYERLTGGSGAFASTYAAYVARTRRADLDDSFVRGLRDRSPGRRVRL
jgi:prevent-host-death family protein